MGNKPGFAIYHITINLKSTPNASLISQQQKLSQFLKRDFFPKINGKSVKFRRTRMGYPVFPSRDTLLLQEDDVMPFWFVHQTM